ncbi:hypothetical protein [Clostridium sp. JS66]|uniref:hypothetical protein n=1 Tax=Clostridium sp. JS66 TaxID=3064705 RepID=UPI00298E6B2F|nr:hypothetical protein [Clostridium sp. JS66]WPC41181.1 hypothetical protein Q6H37_25320 [Clostridium sp. JS66]
MKNETLRLIDGLSSDEKVNCESLSMFTIKCNQDSSNVLAKCKEVLKIVLENNENIELTLEDWKKLLPKWFIEKFGKEITQEEAEERIKLPIEERMEKAWRLSAWIYWFEPNERQWYWYDAKVIDNNTIHLLVECEGWPFAWGALEWLFKVCGAIAIEEK